jgi:pyruvate dehydrogenase E2 component (dihydrolipoamide acetyltransferase)
MSLELKIEALTAAVTALTAQLQSGNVAAPAPVAPAPAPVVQAAPVAAAPIAAPAPVAAAPVMPAPPTFAAPVAAPAPTGAPFSDGKGLIDYVMGAYKALGPQKGALIQGVLTGLGYQNINDVKPEHYAALHTGVEALK